MPAVQLARLKIQVDQLIWQFTRPQDFQRALKHLLETYADWSYRPGEAIEPGSLLPAYHVAPLLLHQVEQQLTRQCQEMPAAALALADALWQDEYFEPRLLAAFILGQIPLKPVEEVSRRILTWANISADKQLQEAIFSQATLRLRRENPAAWLEIINDWLAASPLASKVMGLRALAGLLEDREFEDLPGAFNLLQPLMLTAPSRLHGDLLMVLQIIVRRSPVETTHFLRQVLLGTSSLIPARLVRQILPSLSPELQASLRRSLAARS
jgi:hypothetical protein